MDSASDTAPDHTLPPVRSSALQVKTRAIARGVTRRVNEVVSPAPKPQAPPREVPVVSTTLGALAARIKGGLDEGQDFDPAAYLRRTGAQTQRHTGAGLAGAALKKLRKQ